MRLRHFLSVLTATAAASLLGHSAFAAEATPITRAVSLAPHITELIFAAGAGDKIIATVTSSDYPAAAQRIPKIGNGMTVSAEKILSLTPDLVAAWRPSGAAQTLAPTLAKSNIPLVYIQPEQLDDIPREITRLGQLFGTEAIARPAAQALQKRLQALRKRYSGRRSVSVFIEVGTAPLYTIGRDPLLNDALRTCGGVNIFSHSAIAAPQVSAESLLIAQPDVVITTKTDPVQLAGRVNEWSSLHLAAAMNQHVYALDPDELFRPGPRLIDAAETLCGYLEQAR